MPRNVERDAREAERRKNQLIRAGFKMFSEKGIDNVSLQSIAEAADVGVATMYKYYKTKVNLVVAISSNIWAEVIRESIEKKGNDKFTENTAYQNIEFYLNLIINIYKEHPEILRFSGNYKTYIRREKIENSILKEFTDELEPAARFFSTSYERAKVDGSIRTDKPEKEMYTTVALTMLGMAERFALGIVWTADEEEERNNNINELENVKEMILDWCKKK